MKSSRGFTLIELLVVIAIIGILSSVIIGNVQLARKKANDAKTIATFREVRTALSLYFDKYGKYPLEGLHDIDNEPFVGDFETMAQELVNEGLLSDVPHPPTSNTAYNYYNYGLTTRVDTFPAYTGPGKIGALLETTLEAASPSVNGLYNSCRPFNVVNNWCNADGANPDTEYCVCSPY